MGTFALTRIDNRMIHGQVASGWIGKCSAGKIVVIDTATAENEMMRDILSLAVPPGIEFSVYTKEEGVLQYKADQFGNESIMLIFKDIKTAYECCREGISYPSLQIGGTGVREGAKVLEGPITVTEKECGMLNELQDSGVEIYLQQTVQSKSTKWSEARKKL